MAGIEDNTATRLKVAAIMVSDRTGKHWTYEMARRLGINRSSAMRIFKRFEMQGWVKSFVEDEHNVKKSEPRIYYSLTDNGVAGMRDALTPFQMAPVST